MNIRLERSLVVPDGAETLRRRVLRWAQKYGWTCTAEEPGKWSFRRGTRLQAFYTFDIRKVPTVVTVAQSGDQSVHCSIHVKSWLQWTTPGDPRRVEEQLDLLLAYVKGAYDGD